MSAPQETGWSEQRLNENLRLLGFSDAWVELGLLTPDSLEALVREFHAGNDPNTEHWRYRVFREFVAANQPLPAKLAEALYDLAEADDDLGAAMKTDLLHLRECPEALLERALASGDRHLVRTVQRRRLLDAASAGVTDAVFAAVLASSNVYVQREVLDCNLDLTREQVVELTTAGANRTVRNLATVRLTRMDRKRSRDGEKPAD